MKYLYRKPRKNKPSLKHYLINIVCIFISVICPIALLTTITVYAFNNNYFTKSTEKNTMKIAEVYNEILFIETATTSTNLFENNITESTNTTMSEVSTMQSNSEITSEITSEIISETTNITTNSIVDLTTETSTHTTISTASIQKITSTTQTTTIIKTTTAKQTTTIIETRPCTTSKTTTTSIFPETETISTKSTTNNVEEWTGQILTPSAGTIQGPSGKETYYNLDMTGVVREMKSLGYDYEYKIRDDGVKMFGPYVMCAANLKLRPKGTLIQTSLGMGIVCDTGGFAHNNTTQIDIAVTW